MRLPILPRLFCLAGPEQLSRVHGIGWCRVLGPRSVQTRRPSETAALDTQGPEEATVLAGKVLSGMPLFHDRVRCVEELGDECLGPLFFVDDIACAYPADVSTEAVRSEAFSKFAAIAKAAFDFGPGTTASMACFDAPPCTGHVDVYKLLGVQVDKELTFNKRLDIILAIGRSSFDEPYHLAESLGLAISAEVSEVQSRIEPLVLYGAELF